MTLYQRYRPASFDEVAGAKNKQMVAALRAVLATDDPPHAYLFHGPRGCGKTSMGRLVASELGCSEDDFREVDSADFRGIDTIREMRHNSHYKALHGTRRVWLLDECFAAGTLVATPSGGVGIDTLRPGSMVYSLAGPSRVLHVFRNVVYLDRIVRLYLSNGRTVYTTKDHLFLTDEGFWRTAASLRIKDLLLPFGSNIMYRKDFAIGLHVDNSTHLSGMRRHFRSEEIGAGVLFPPVRVQPRETVEETCMPSFASVPSVRYFLCPEEQQGSEVLFKTLREQGNRRCVAADTIDPSLYRLRGAGGLLAEPEIQQSYLQSCLRERGSVSEMYWADAVGGGSAQHIGWNRQITRSDHRVRSKAAEVALRSDEGFQSVSDAWRAGEGQGDEADQGFPARLEGGTRRQWQAYRSPDYVSDHSRLADRGVYSDWACARRGWVPYELQGRYRECGSEDRGRGGRQGSFDRSDEDPRSQEGGEARGVRVDRVEVYQRGCNDGDFRRVVGDRERRQGFAVFYDLEVEDDPSYFVEGVAVHNCHKISNDGMHAFLKGLEDPPSHCYYILCTTEPDKLLPTIRSRCSIHQVHTLDDDEMLRLLHRIASKEGAKLPRPTLQAIVDASTGHVRDALQVLQTVIAAPESAEQTVAGIEVVNAKSIDLCRALMNGKGWRAVSTILADLRQEDVESIRRAVMGYCSAVLLKGENNRAGAVMNEFVSPFYDNGYPGLVFAAYTVVCGGG